MSLFRLSRPAQADLANLLSMSAERWGAEGRRRYAATLATAMRRVAAEPQGRGTRDRADLLPGIRSFHIRHAGRETAEVKVRRPVHILYYRVVQPGLIEIVRVLHERMEPSRHLSADT
jgi:toxin ParE1/3/4